MVLFSHLRKLLGLALAVLIVATSVQPVQAHLRYGEGGGAWLADESSSVDQNGPLDSVVYISEESEWQAGRKGPSHRLGAEDLSLTAVELPSPVLIPILRYAPPYRAPPAEDGIFLSPLKTGPPSL